MQLFQRLHDQHRDRERDLTSDWRSEGGAWHSFTALFGDYERGVSRAPTPASASPVFPTIVPLLPEPPKDSEVASGYSASTDRLVDVDFSDQELSDLRVEIGDINETLRHHDLWVKDAEAMRGEVEELKQTSDSYKAWLENITGLLRHMNARGIETAQQVAALRLQIERVEIRLGGSLAPPDVCSAVNVSSLSRQHSIAGSFPSQTEELYHGVHRKIESNGVRIPSMPLHASPIQPVSQQVLEDSMLALSSKVHDLDFVLKSQLAGFESSLRDGLQAEHIELRRERIALQESRGTLPMCHACEHVDVCEVSLAQAQQPHDLLRAAEEHSVGAASSASSPEPWRHHAEEAGIRTGTLEDDRGKNRVASRSDDVDALATGRRPENYRGAKDSTLGSENKH